MSLYYNYRIQYLAQEHDQSRSMASQRNKDYELRHAHFSFTILIYVHLTNRYISIKKFAAYFSLQVGDYSQILRPEYFCNIFAFFQLFFSFFLKYLFYLINQFGNYYFIHLFHHFCLIFHLYNSFASVLDTGSLGN